MRSLTPTLLEAQKQQSREAIWKIVLSKTGEDTLTYEADRITYLQHRIGQSSEAAQVILKNNDHALRDLALEGYQGDISIGCVTPQGEEFGQEAPQWVLTQQLYSLANGELICVLNLGGLINLFNLDKASEAYNPAPTDTRTIKDWLIEIATLQGAESSSVEEQTDSDSAYSLYRVPTWEDSKNYGTGSFCIGTGKDNRSYEATTGGTSGSTEPTWDTTLGNTTNDGTVVWTCRTAPHSFVGQKKTISNRVVTKIGFYLKKVGNPTGDITFHIDSVGTGSDLVTKVLGDASSLTTSYAWYEVTLDNAIRINEEVRMVCEFLNGNSINYVSFAYKNSSVKASEELTEFYVSGWIDHPTQDATYRYYYLSDPINSFNHCQPIELVFDSEDSLIDSFQPKDSFHIGKRETRRAVFEKAMAWTGCVWKYQSDSKIHIFVPKSDTSTVWVATTAYSLRNEVIPTTANNYVYICTTAGTSGSAEPTWKTGIGDTITDGTVVWTVAYDYEFELAYDDANKHTIYDRAHNRRLTMPSHITVESRSQDAVQYSGTAQTTDHSSRPSNLQKQDFIETLLASNAQATSIAQTLINAADRDAETGSARVPMNVGTEEFDFVNFVDVREGKSRNGIVRHITKTCQAGDEGGIFEMQIRLGLVSSDAPLGIYPTSTLPRSMEVNFLLLDEAVTKLNDKFINLQLDFGKLLDSVKGIFAVIDTLFDGKRILVFALNGSVALTTDDKAYLRIPLAMSGWILARAAAMVKGASSSGAVTLTVKNGATSMLSTDITLDVNEYDTLTAATPPVVDTAEDDVSTGDQIEVAVTGAGTGVTYCVVELTFTKDV